MNIVSNWLGILLIIAVVVWFFRKRKNQTKPMVDLDKKFTAYTVDDRYNISRKQKEKELNALLEKISHNGMSSLTEEERKRLQDLSK